MTAVTGGAAIRALQLGTVGVSHQSHDDSTPLFEGVGMVAGSDGAEVIRSISLRPRTQAFDLTSRH